MTTLEIMKRAKAAAPELAGRDTELSAFEVVLERIAHGRPERSLVLTGLRGVGKTVLLNQLRSAAISKGWGTGKIEARPEQSIRRPGAAALHTAIRFAVPLSSSFSPQRKALPPAVQNTL